MFYLWFLCVLLGIDFFHLFFFFCYVSSFYFSCVSYNLGFDNYSYLFICLSCLICLIIVYSILMYSFFGFSYFLFYVNFLFFTLLIVFSVMDFFILFFFECSLVPLFLIIFGWGYQPERLQAVFFYFIYFICFFSLFIMYFLYFF